MLGDDNFVTSGGECFIYTKENNEKDLNSYNQAIGKNFDIIITTNL